MKLKKGSAFHLDFFVLGLGVFLTGILGIPPTNGLIPQAPLHTKSLMVKKRIFIDGSPTDKFEISKVYEQRMSNLAQSFLIGLVCFRPFSDALREIPNAVLYGLFLFLGLSSFEDNEFSYRMTLLVMEPKLRKCSPHPYDFVSALDFRVIQKYTAVQIVLCCIIFVITFTPAGVIFPVLIAMLILIRLYALPRLFSPEELDALDTHIINEASDTADSDSCCSNSGESGGDSVNAGGAVGASGDEHFHAPIPIKDDANCDIELAIIDPTSPSEGAAVAASGVHQDMILEEETLYSSPPATTGSPLKAETIPDSGSGSSGMLSKDPGVSAVREDGYFRQAYEEEDVVGATADADACNYE